MASHRVVKASRKIVIRQVFPEDQQTFGDMALLDENAERRALLPSLRLAASFS